MSVLYLKCPKENIYILFTCLFSLVSKVIIGEKQECECTIKVLNSQVYEMSFSLCLKVDGQGFSI